MKGDNATFGAGGSGGAGISTSGGTGTRRLREPVDLARADRKAADRADRFLNWARKHSLGRAIFGDGKPPGPHAHQVGSSPSIRGVERIEHSLVLACKVCRAPGTYHSHESIRAGWPGCWSEELHGQKVGDICPNCGSDRPAEVSLGVIHERHF